MHSLINVALGRAVGRQPLASVAMSAQSWPAVFLGCVCFLALCNFAMVRTSASSKAVDALSPAEKRARLLTLTHGSYVSHSGLEHVVREVQRQGVPEASSRRTQTRYRAAEARRRTPYGTLVENMDIPTVEDDDRQSTATIAYLNPFAMLHVAVETCAVFARCVLSAWREHPAGPDSPWRLILYADEIGHSPLASVDPRAVQAIYFSFAELGGQSAIHREWMVCTGRHSVDDRQQNDKRHVPPYPHSFAHCFFLTRPLGRTCSAWE